MWTEWTELGSGQYRTNVDRIGPIWTELTELDRCGLNKTEWAEQKFRGQNGLNRTELE